MSDLLSTVGAAVPAQCLADYRCESCHQTGHRLYELAAIGLPDAEIPFSSKPFLVCGGCLPT